MELEELPTPEFEGTIHPDELEVDGENPNEQSEEMFGLLCENMRQYGWLGNAIVTDVDGVIADGEHRWRAAKEIGLEEVPVKQYDIDEATRRLWRQELNKISGDHDPKRDALEYDQLLKAGRSDDVQDLVEATGEDLDKLLERIRVSNAAPVGYEYDVDHAVHFEDCIAGMRHHLEPDSVDCVITDPPYGMAFHNDRTDKWTEGDRVKDWDMVEGDGSIEEAVQLVERACVEFRRVMKEGAHAYIFCEWRGYPEIKAAVERYLTVKNCLVWDKGSVGIGDLTNNWGYSHELIIFATKGDRADELAETSRNVLEHGRPTRTDYVHPTQKPESLMVQLIQASTETGDIVLDPFMGSGTTAVAAIQNGRDYVGFEIDEEHYRDVIERRIGEATRQSEATVNSDSER
jgi:DNA modification methylase